MKSTLAIVSSLAIATLLALVPFAGPAQARNITCGGETMHWSVKSGSLIDITVGWVELRIEVCSDGNSITSTSASVNHDVTGPGTTAGYVISVGSPARISFDSGGFDGGEVTYYAGASLKDCLPGGITVICSDAYDFSVRGTITMLNGIYWDAGCDVFCEAPGNQFEVHHRVFQTKWWWVCRNDVCQNCGVELNGTCKP